MGLSFWQIALVLILLFLLFGRGKIPALMTDVAEGINAFKKGINNQDPKNIEQQDNKPEENITNKQQETSSEGKA